MQADEDGEELRPDYNVAPTKKIYAVMTRRPPGLAGAGEGGSIEGSTGGNGSGGNGEAAASDPAPVRQLRTVRWGLVPSWAKDPAIGSRMINARAETVASKPAYRRAFTKRRCLIPADGYYEWYKPGEDAKAAKNGKNGLLGLGRGRSASDQASLPITLKRGSPLARSIRTRSIAPGAARWP